MVDDPDQRRKEGRKSTMYGVLYGGYCIEAEESEIVGEGEGKRLGGKSVVG